MRNSRIDAVTLAAVMIAAGVALAVPGMWLTSIVGLVLLLILFAYDQEGERSSSQSLTFAAVCGFCLMLVATPPLHMLGLHGFFAAYALPLTWLVATLVFWTIDRQRVSGHPIGSEYGHETVKTPVPAARAVETVPMEKDVRAPQPPAARPGKETSIYVNLVGEGLNLMRGVRAEEIARGYYRITEEMPEGETWEYGPGQVVRCEKRKLSTGKGLVAVAEAQRQA